MHLCVLWMLSGGLACAQTGLMSTYAGNGFSGPFVDGVTATSATLFGPAGLAVDSNGNLFIADTNNSRIRKVSGGIMTTVAGGGGQTADMVPALQAQLANPCDVKVDSAGNLYISESCVTVSSGLGDASAVMNRVRRVDAVTGIISTIAGGLNAGFAGDGGPPGSASLLNTPAGLALDASGSLYIADSGNNRIRRIDGITGILTTVAGNGAATFAGDGGLASAASLNSPSAVAVDAAGNLYIADAGNSRIRRVDAATGIITTLAGTGSTSYNGDGILATGANLGFPSALVVNGSGNLLFTDILSNRVRLVDNSTGLIWTIAGDGTNPPGCCGDGPARPATIVGLNVPAGVALSPMGLMFIAAHGGQRVLQVALQNPLVSTALNVTASDASVPPGSPLTLTGVLSVMNGSPASVTASVHFVEAGFAIGSAPLVNGSASFSTSSLQLGPHSITGQYFGDSVYSPVISPPVSVTITAAQSSVALAANPSPANTGQPVTLTATVTPSSATGSVNFFNGTMSLGMANISNGTATLTGVVLMDGSYSLSAQYSGNINLPSSTSPAITLNVKAFSSVVLTSSVNPSTPGQAVTFIATVSPATASGSVQFMDNGSLIGTYFFMSGPATFTISTLTSGTHSITASYSGDTNNMSATSAGLSQTVRFPSSVVIASSQNLAPVGDPLTFTATVTPGNATGTVQFLDGTTLLGTGTIAAGSASFTTSTLAQGTHYSITAVYGGDANNAGSTSAPFSLIQTMQAKVALTLASSLNPSTVGQTVTFTANTNPAAPGTVQFLDGAAVLATVPLSNSGVAAFSTSTLTQRTHSITANYSGATYYVSAQSSALIQTVNLIATTTTLTSTPNPAPIGSAVTLLASVTPSAATGTVQFLEGTTVLGTGTLSNGSASFITSALTQGTHSITAVYGGDGSNAGSTSAPLSQSMKSSAGMTTGLNPSPGVTGQNVTLIANMNAAATGTVTFTDGNTVLATVAVASGSAFYSNSTLTQGSHILGISYSGDSTYMSQSTTIAETILGSTSITVASNANPAVTGQSVTFTATVTPTAATGNVQFYDGQTSVGIVALSGGTASYSTAALTPGTHSITANYLFSSSYAPSFSNTLAETVKTNTSVALTSTPNSALAGGAVTFNATVNPATATGTVQFLDGTTVLGTATLISGSASFATSTLTQGTHFITAAYGGDAAAAASTSVVLSQSIKVPAGLTVGISPSPGVAGQTVTITANMNAAATGTVQVTDGGTVLATVPVSSGVASYSTASLTAGPHLLGISYSGDVNYGSASTSANEAVLVATSVVLVTSTNPLTVGQSTTFTAIVMPNSGTGTVQFFDGSALLGTTPVVNGMAAFSTASLTKGSHTISATYSGDSANAPATSPSLTEIVRGATLISLVPSANPSNAGQSVSFSASLTPSTSIGTIQFLDGSTVLSTVTVNSGSASFATSTLAPGAHSITAFYSGDNTDSPVTSAAISQTVNQASTTTSLTSGQNPSNIGAPVTLTAIVTPSNATGAVQFFNGSTLLGLATVSVGEAQLTTTALPAGTYSLTAAYKGDANYTASTSAALLQTVNKTVTTTTLISSWNPSLVGGAVTVTALVTPGIGTGSVQFFDGSTVLGTGTLSNGSASFTTAALAHGPHSITAVYGGDGSYTGSTSAALSQSVKSLVGLDVVVSPTPALAGRPITIRATMNAAATGIVTFSDGSTVLATVPVRSGAASYSTFLTAGVHMLSIGYSGDANFMSAGTSFPQVVQAVSSIRMTSSLNPSIVGQAVTFTAMVTPSTATGTVQFLDLGQVPIGTATLSSGLAVFSTSSLNAGTYSLTASYAGDAKDTPASSATLMQTVKPKSAASVSLTSSVDPSLVGQTVMFTAHLTPSTATGTIQFLDGTTVIGTVAVNSGAAAFPTSQLTQGSHSITASYSGDARYMAATSAILIQTVTPRLRLRS